jgi:DNA-binding NtrC family response regulator
VGVGTSFTIRLSREAASERSADPGPAELDEGISSDGPLDATVLLVDDEQAFVDALGRRLARRGATVHVALSGEEAMARLEQSSRSIDLVFLDMRMKTLDGLTTLREIKRRWPVVAVVILSGQADIDAAVEGMKIGAIDYLIKPVELHQVLRLIRLARSQKKNLEQKILEAQILEITMRRI